jgi:hypothetical protein
MEKIVRDQIMNHLTLHNLINQNQHGLVKQKACVTNLLEAVDYVSSSMSDKIPVDVAFMDFAKAFDLVPYKRLLHKLSSYGICGSLLNWIRSFLNKRQQRVVMGDYVSLWIEVLSGVPQGSVLGPILFIIFINEISDIISSQKKLYADDAKIYTRITSVADSNQLQYDIDNLVEWSRVWLMRLNESKCKVMHIGKENQQYMYTINTSQNAVMILSKSTLERDLGVMISSDLKWKHHTAYCANKANRVLGMLKRTFEHFDLDMVKILYTTFVRPHLEFAASVWNPYAANDISLLEKVQRRATKLVPALKSLAYEKRLVAMNLTELADRRIRGDMIQLYKFMHGIDVVNWYECKNLKERIITVGVSTRMNSLKLERELIKNCEQRYNFFNNRVVNDWNNLKEDVVNAPTVNSFKAAYDRLHV